MNHERLKADLQKIYDDYESEVHGYKAGAVCGKGCAFCCTHYGNLDITTLEGMIIHRHISRLPKQRKIQLQKAVSRNRRLKAKRKTARCPFLNKSDTCMIYAVRPFSCRQLYSLKKCGECGPTIHRQAADLAGDTVIKLQELDPNGYSGHISYILHLLQDDAFRDFYLNGGFDPEKIRPFAQPCGIVINRAMAKNAGEK